MTTRHEVGFAYGAAFKSMIEGAAGLPVVICLTRVRREGEDGLLVFDVAYTESVAHTDSVERICACGCGVAFFPVRPKQIYVTDNCRLRAFRAQQKLGLIDSAADEGAS